MSDTTEIELTEQELIEWLIDLDVDPEDVPREFSITPEEEADE